MAKIDILLKRVEAFEKLAIYSDRSTFLKKLTAQHTANWGPIGTLTNKIRNVIDNLKLENAPNAKMLTQTLINAHGAPDEAGNVNYDELMGLAQQAKNSLINKQSADELINTLQQLMNNPSVTMSGTESPHTESTTTQTAPSSNYQGPMASAKYMINSAMDTVRKLFPAEGPQAEQRKYQVSKGLRPKVQMMINMFNQNKNNKSVQQALYDGLKEVYNTMSYDDYLQVPEFRGKNQGNFGTLLTELEEQLNSGNNSL